MPQNAQSLLSPTLAATLAQAVYRLEEQRNIADALGPRAPRGPGGGAAVGQGLMAQNFELSGAAVAGESGPAMLTKATGFGMVLKGTGPSTGDIAVVCRGTSSWRDWLTDANFSVDPGPGSIPVHAGFARTYKTMKADVEAGLRKVPNPTNIHVIGHSLGGALASLFAVQFGIEGRGNVHLYSFGCPRPGSRAFSSAVQRYIPSAQRKRVYALADPVPMVPIWPFEHPSDGLRTDSGGQLLSGSAHKMTNYGPAVDHKSWSALTSDANGINDMKSVDYWLERAKANTSFPGSSMALSALAYALKAILKTIDVVLGSFLLGAATIIDKMVMALHRGLTMADEKISGWVQSLISGIFRYMGRPLQAGMDLTRAVLRYAVEMLLRSLVAIASRALGQRMI